MLQAADPPAPDGTTDAHVALTEGIAFVIPERLSASQGNAGNHDAVLRYRDPQSVIVTCTYRGGASVPEPTTPIDVARGLTYVFVSCTNGAAAGSTVVGTEFWLEIEGVTPQSSGEYNEVALHLDGCGGELDPPFWPEESAEMAMAFSWAATSPVPEADAQGRPALYYASIYIEDPEQLGSLDDAYIHYDPMPIFTSELERYRGKCGTVDAGGDGEGFFVFAVLPGETYNLLREYALTPSPETGEDRTVFDVVILRTPPAGAGNPDGSLSWQALMDAAFLYRGETEFTEPDQQQPRRRGWLRRFCRDAARVIGQTVQNTVRVVENTLGAVHLALKKDTNSRITLQAINRDPQHEGEMKQAWGARAGQVARPSEVKVDVRMWLATPLVPMVAPTLFSGIADDNGYVEIKVPRDADTRYEHPICVYLDNHAATVTDFLIPVRLCDFGGGGQPIETQNPVSDVPVTSNHHKLHMHTALTDAYRYFRDVVGYEPHRVQVLTDWLANHFTGKWHLGHPPLPYPDDHPAFASCMGLNDRDEAWGLLLGQIPYEGPLGAVLIAASNADITMPDKWWSKISSRGTIVHEYGHFTLCSLIYDSAPGALHDFLMARITAWSPIEEDDDVSILSDAFADLVASQVVGGVDYVLPSGGAYDLAARMMYCASPDKNLPCLEGNATGVDWSGGFAHRDDSDSATVGGYAALARVLSTWHDAFDGHYGFGDLRLSNVPGNADYYSDVGTYPNDHFAITPRGWVRLLPTMTGDDENVSLPGSAIYDWGMKWSAVRDSGFTIASAMRALSETMYEGQPPFKYTWCNACELFTLHEEGFAIDTPFWDRWLACREGRLAEYVGVPPNPLLNMSYADCESCELHEYTDAAGICRLCDPGQYAVLGDCADCEDGTILSTTAETCVDCDPRWVSNPTHTACDPCGDGEIAVANVCTTCDPGKEPVPDADDCVTCPDGEVSQTGICYPCGDGYTSDPWHVACVPCPVDEQVNYFSDHAIECVGFTTWMCEKEFSLAAGVCGNSHDVLLKELLSIPADQDITVEARRHPVSEEDCAATTGTFRIRYERGSPVELPFVPVYVGYGGCHLSSIDIGESIRYLVVDEAEVSLVTNSEVDLIVTSGPGACLLP